MPNTGKPSRDCHLCRRRRVKCDLARPSCQRCIKYGAQCPGYRDMKSLMFRNTYAQCSPGSRAGTGPFGACGPNLPPDHAAGTTEAYSSRWISCDLQDVPTPSPTLAPVKEHWTTYSIPLLKECFSAMDFYIYQLGKLPESHPLVLVTHVFARAYMVNRYNAPQDKREVSVYLGKALRGIQAAIDDASRCKEDATLATVWLLGNYEILTGGFDQRGPDASAWLVHSSGLASLLRNRGARNLMGPHARQLFWTTYHIIQIRCMVSNMQCPSDLTVWLDELEGSVTPEEELLLNISKFIRITCFLFELAMPLVLAAKGAQLCEIYPHIMQTLEEAEAICPRISHRPVDLTQLHFWTSWCSCRIKLNYVITMISSLVEHTPNSPYNHDDMAWQRNTCRDDTARMAADIIRSLPKSLGGSELDSDLNSHSGGAVGLRLIWPLSATYMIPTVPTRYRLAARDALLKIGRDVGVLQALRDYSRGKRFPRAVISDIMKSEVVPTDGYIPDICAPSTWEPSDPTDRTSE